LLTIVTTAKPFVGRNAILQRDAIRSWLLLRPACEVILFGNEEGAADIAAKLGIRHVPVIEYNEFGSTLLNSLLGTAQKIAGNDLLCYIHSDIILMSDFLPAVQTVKKERFLMVGQRYDLDLKDYVNFEDPEWEFKLRTDAVKRGKLHSKGGISYFVFTRGLYNDIPPIGIGRTADDNWLIYKIRSLNVPVIDATEVVTVVHQNHDYSHYAGGSTAVFGGTESQRNVELIGGLDHAFTTEYATDILTPKGLKPAISPRHIYFRLRAFPILHPRLHFLLAPFKLFEKLVRSARSTKKSG